MSTDKSIGARPIGLWIVGVILVIEAVLAVFQEPQVLASIPLFALSIGFAWLVVAGSRIAWVICTGVAMTQLVLAVLGHYAWWGLVLSAGVLALLLARPTRRFVWRTRSPQSIEHSAWNPLAWFAWIEACSRTVSARLVSRKPLPLLEAKVMWSLVIAFIVLVPVVGELRQVHEGDDGTLILDVLWRIVWVSFNLFQVALVGLLAAAAYRLWKTRSDSSVSPGRSSPDHIRDQPARRD